jgi:signal transduction histidine kinase
MGPVRRLFFRHPRVSDVLVLVVVGVPGLIDVLTSGRSTHVALTATVSLLGTAALWWRRSHSLVVLGLTTATMVVNQAVTATTGGMEIALTFALYAVAASRPARTSWIAAGLVSAAAMVTIWFTEPLSEDPISRQDGQIVLANDRIGGITAIAISVLFAMAIGVSVHNRREHVAELIERTNALARDRDRQAELARAAERTRIAREMHDVVAHSLSVMISLADGATAALERSPERTRMALTELSSTGRAALGDMRRVLGALHDDDAPLEPTGAETDLETLVHGFVTAGMPLHTDGLRLPLPADTGLRLAIYRVVQESLTNVLRHAPGTARVDLTLRRGPAAWLVDVVDQGPASLVPPSPGSGQGVIGMRERAAVLGGTVDAGPAGTGWRVRVTFPAPEEDR